MQPNQFDHSASTPLGYGSAAAVRVPALLTRVYQWMTLGLGVTGAVAMIVAGQPDLYNAILRTPLLWVLLLATVGMSIALQSFAMRMAAPVAFGVFFLFSALMGVSLAPVFLAYNLGDIGVTFLVTAGTFGGMTLYGYVTKKDLSGWGSFLFMGLWGMLLASIVNVIFLRDNGLLYWLTTYVGVIVFTGLAAYDTQRIKRLALAAGPGAPPQLAIQGATMLYLDFINLFVLLLRIFGGGRSRD